MMNILRQLLDGPRMVLSLYFNNLMAKDARERKAVNSMTVNSAGARGNHRSIPKIIARAHIRGVYTLAEAPDHITPTMVKTDKVKMLLHTMYPPAVSEGVASSTYLSHDDVHHVAGSRARLCDNCCVVHGGCSTGSGLLTVSGPVCLWVCARLRCRRVSHMRSFT